MILVIEFCLLSIIGSIWIAISNNMFSTWYGIILFVLILLAGFVIFLFIFLFVLYVITLKENVKDEIDEPNKFYSKLCYEFAEMLCILSGLNIQVNGIEKIPQNERFLLISNHRSNLDPIVGMNKFRKFDIIYISKISNFHIPVIGKCIHKAGYLAIDRENARNAVKTINKAAEYIKRDIGSIAIYPEGTRTKGENMIDFHAGSFKIAKKTNSPIVISSIRGTEKCKYLFFYPSKVVVDIIDVIPSEKVKVMKTAELSEKARKLIAEKLISYGDNVNA